MFKFDFTTVQHVCVTEASGQHVATLVNDSTVQHRLQRALQEHFDIDVSITDFTVHPCNNDNEIPVVIKTEEEDYEVTITPTWLY